VPNERTDDELVVALGSRRETAAVHRGTEHGDHGRRMDVLVGVNAQQGKVA
jgi:hypothetical protein